MTDSSFHVPFIAHPLWGPTDPSPLLDSLFGAALCLALLFITLHLSMYIVDGDDTSEKDRTYYWRTTFGIPVLFALATHVFIWLSAWTVASIYRLFHLGIEDFAIPVVLCLLLLFKAILWCMAGIYAASVVSSWHFSNALLAAALGWVIPWFIPDWSDAPEAPVSLGFVVSDYVVHFGATFFGAWQVKRGSRIPGS